MQFFQYWKSRDKSGDLASNNRSFLDVGGLFYQSWTEPPLEELHLQVKFAEDDNNSANFNSDVICRSHTQRTMMYFHFG